MRISDECLPYLQSEEVIDILQRNNQTFETRVFNCLDKMKEQFYYFVPYQHYLIKQENLVMLRRDAFMQSVHAFFDNVKNKQFQPLEPTCVAYVFKIFKNIFLKEFNKELKIKQAEILIMNGESSTEENVDEIVHKKLEQALAMLSQDDQNLFSLKYAKKMSAKDIAKKLEISEGTVPKKLERLRKRFVITWNQVNKNAQKQ